MSPDGDNQQMGREGVGNNGGNLGLTPGRLREGEDVRISYCGLY